MGKGRDVGMLQIEVFESKVSGPNIRVFLRWLLDPRHVAHACTVASGHCHHCQPSPLPTANPMYTANPCRSAAARP